MKAKVVLLFLYRAAIFTMRFKDKIIFLIKQITTKNYTKKNFYGTDDKFSTVGGVI